MYIYHLALKHDVYQPILYTHPPTPLFSPPLTMSTKPKALYLLEAKGQYAVQERDVLEPGPGEVLVQIRAAALNPVDWKLHDWAVFLTEYPAILGSDSSGVIAKLGEGVTSFAIGDRM